MYSLTFGYPEAWKTAFKFHLELVCDDDESKVVKVL